MNDAKKLARAVMKAVELHEGSYDREAADKASMETQYPNYNKFFRISLEQACNQVSPECGRLIYLALDAWPNDTIDWATEILK